MNYAQVLKDVASVCQTLRAFIRESLSRLEHLSPNQYIAALNGFFFPEFRHKWIANPIEGSGNYTLFDDVRIHLVPRETAPDSGQFRVFEYYETEHLQTLLKLDFYKGLEAGHLIRKCELCGRLFLLQKGYHTKYCDSPNPDNPRYSCAQLGYRMRGVKETAADSPLTQALSRGIIMAEEQMRLRAKAEELCEHLSTGAYDEDRGKLTTYLHPFLRGKMYRYLEANVGVIAPPKDEMQRVKQAQRLHKEEKFSLDEVAQMLGVSAEKAAQLIGCKTKPLSVSALSNDASDDDPLAWLLLDQHTLTPEQAVYRQVCTEELEQLFRTLSAKDRAILGHTYGVFSYEKLSADELGLREMLSPDGVTKARKSALERLRSRYPGSGLHLWRDVYHALKDI